MTLTNIVTTFFTSFTATSFFVAAFHRRKDRRLTTAWTENNNGVDLPHDMDASHHSGATESDIELCTHKIPKTDCAPCNCAHDAGFTSGELPGGRKIKHCKLCGFWTDALHAIGERIGEAKFGQ